MTNNYPTCKTCKFRAIDETCQNEHISENYYYTKLEESTMLIYSYSEGGSFTVGDNFGCIHHQPLQLTTESIKS